MHEVPYRSFQKMISSRKKKQNTERAIYHQHPEHYVVVVGGIITEEYNISNHKNPGFVHNT